MHRGNDVPMKPPIMINVHSVRVRMFWRFLSGLSDCAGGAVAAGCVINCGGGITVISDCSTKGAGCTAGRSSLTSRLLGSGIDGVVAGSGSRTGSGAGRSGWRTRPFVVAG